MGISYSMKEDKRIFINTDLKSIELSNIKHLIDVDKILIYYYGLNSNGYKDLICISYDVENSTSSLYCLLQNHNHIYNIAPSKCGYNDAFIINNNHGLIYYSPMNKKESQIKDDAGGSVYKSLLWSEMNENIMIGVSLYNTIEIIDIELDRGFIEPIYEGNSNVIIPDKVIIDSNLMEHSPYANCMCMSMNDSSLVIFDYNNKKVIDNISTGKLVKDISVNHTSHMKISCAEVTSNTTHIYDLR